MTVRDLRRSMKLTQAEFADLVGCSLRMLKYYEHACDRCPDCGLYIEPGWKHKASIRKLAKRQEKK